MTNILNKKIAVVVMLVAFLSSLTPSFAINQATPLRTTVSNSQKDDIKAVKLVGDVNLKKGNQLISVSLRDSDVKQVLRMFADKAGLNIVFHNSVEGTVTLDLVNVTLNNAFKMIMSAAELAYYIENDTLNGHLTKCKLLGKPMMNAPATDVMDYLYQFAETDPSRIIDLYTSTDSSLMLLMIDAKERNVIRKVNGLWMYGENVLGATDDAILLYMKTPQNKVIYDALRDETYPEFVTKASKVEPAVEPTVEAPAKTTKSKK